MVAIGTNWQASLVSDQRGPVLKRRTKTRADAFAQAHRLLDDAEDRQWHRGEAVSVRVEQAEEWPTAAALVREMLKNMPKDCAI
jgi:hypothetical protein